MKRYFVVMHTKERVFKKQTNSYRIAKWFADLNCWKYAKIHDSEASDTNPPFSKCIYTKKKES